MLTLAYGVGVTVIYKMEEDATIITLEETTIIANNVKNKEVYRSEEVVGNYRVIFSIFLLASLWTLILTFVPVFSSVGPSNIYKQEDGWYTGSDVMRFIEPVGGLPINFGIFLESGIFDQWHKKRELTVGVCIFMWMISASIFQQGAGFHSAANMFKV